jgi:hypothetical protein
MAESTQREAAAAKLRHFIGRWSYWVSRCDQLDLEYDRKLEAWRKKYHTMDPVSQVVDFDNSYTGKSLEAAKRWAHTKAQTYASAILVLRELQQEPEVVPGFSMPAPRRAQQTG